MISDVKGGSILLSEWEKVHNFLQNFLEFKQLIGFLMNSQAVHVYSP